MKKFFKKLWIKIFLKVLNRVSPSIEFDENEKTSASICRKLINHQDSKFLIAPLSQKRYIKNEVLQMFVVLQDDRINITNHIYNYDITVPSQMTHKLNRMFDNKVEEARLKFEKEMHSQVQHSLKKILEKLI
jgi:hypothetical protein